MTAVHKANIMSVCVCSPSLDPLRIPLEMCVSPCRKLGDGLFLECCKEVASGYPEITFDSMIVDNTTMQVADGPSAHGFTALSSLGCSNLCVCVCVLAGFQAPAI